MMVNIIGCAVTIDTANNIDNNIRITKDWCAMEACFHNVDQTMVTYFLKDVSAQ